MTRWSVALLNRILDKFETSNYLEIGVQKGNTFREIVSNFKVGVDPEFHPMAKNNLRQNESLIETTSSAFFNQQRFESKYNLIFLDGLHTAEQTYQDFCNAIHLLTDDGFIVIDDVWPHHKEGASKQRIKGPLVDSRWWGDVFKLPFLIKAFHPYFECAYITSENPQLIVWRTPPYRKLKMNETRVLELAEISNLTYEDFVSKRSEFACFDDVDVLMREIESI